MGWGGYGAEITGSPRKKLPDSIFYIVGESPSIYTADSLVSRLHDPLAMTICLTLFVGYAPPKTTISER